ncbi:MAG: M48 family metalloprotease [Candidatus Aminicenantes bacterium]|nr:M48 family metalloprotease [Candidatus Aminicenantes bacterium]
MSRQAVSKTVTKAVIIGIVIGAMSCAVNPVTHKSEFMLLSQNDEVALGQKTNPQILETYGQYPDAALAAYVADLGKKLGAMSDRPNIGYSFQVLDSPVVNAFAVPGGYVYLTRGILAYLNDEAELAGVAAHEIGHIAARHSAQQYSRAQVAQIGLGLGSVVSKTFRKYAGLAEFGVGMLFLSFSRGNERQSDDLGVLYSSKAGYDARNMANLFVTLERLNPGEDRSGLPGWFSTHPNPPDRVVAIQKAAQEWRTNNPQAAFGTHRDSYLKHIDGIVFGEDPRQGYVDGKIFYHPVLKFQFPVPEGWKVNNTAAQVQIVNKNQDAAIVFSKASDQSPSAAAEAFIKQSQAAVLKSEPAQVNGFPAHLLMADITTEQGVIRSLSYFIQKENVVFVFLGYAAQAQFESHLPTFNQTMGQFRNLTDPTKINVQPERLAVRTTSSQGPLRQALQGFGVPQDKWEAAAILNGMKLDDHVPARTLLKVVVK